MKRSRLHALLGFATKARQLVFGQFAVEKAVTKRQIASVLLDIDISRNSREKFVKLCETHNIPCHIVEASLIHDATGAKGDKICALLPCKLAEEIEKIIVSHEDILTNNIGGNGLNDETIEQGR